jgi:hypothetical protein
MIQVHGITGNSSLASGSFIDSCFCTLMPGKSSFGVINDCGIGQSDFMWSVRANRQIKRIFARIRSTRDLLVSFDGCGVFRDWRYDPVWKTSAGWYHVDQNPINKPDLCSALQGFAALTDHDETTGGLVVYPKTHLRFNELCSIARQSGDFVVWDSRLVHCNTPTCVEFERDQTDKVDLLRIVAYVRIPTLNQFRRGINGKNSDVRSMKIFMVSLIQNHRIMNEVIFHNH